MTSTSHIPPLTLRSDIPETDERFEDQWALISGDGWSAIATVEFPHSALTFHPFPLDGCHELKVICRGPYWLIEIERPMDGVQAPPPCEDDVLDLSGWHKVVSIVPGSSKEDVMTYLRKGGLVGGLASQELINLARDQIIGQGFPPPKHCQK